MPGYQRLISFALIFLVWGSIPAAPSASTPSQAEVPGSPEAPEPAPPPLQVGRPAPVFDAPDLNGRPVDVPGLLKGKPALLAFWASWCSECREMLEILERLAVNITGSEARIMGVSTDRKDGRAEQAAAGVALSYPILLDVKQDVVKRYEIDKIPAVVIVDREGMIVTTVTGSAVLKTDYGAAVQTVLEQ